MSPPTLIQLGVRDVPLPPRTHCRISRRSPCRTHVIAHAKDATLSSADAQTATLPASVLPTTYKRLVARRCGASFRDVATVQELELTPPGPGEVLIRITHAGVNGGCETFRARGEYAFAANRQLQDFPLGAEGAGVVVALGPGAAKGGLTVGQRVAVNGAAAFSQFVTSRTSLVVPVPEGVAAGQAAALVLSGVTACVALEATARVRPGEVVAVTAAAGGTGHLAVQLAAAAGAVVVAVVGGASKAAAMAAMGAHHVIDYRAEDVVGAVRRLCPTGLDVVFEGVGGRLREQLMSCLAPRGRLLQVGYISEYPHTHGYGRWGSEEGPATATAVEPGPLSTAATTDSLATAAGSTATCVCGGARGSDGGGGCVDTPPPPSSSELFWRGLDVQRGEQRVIGQIWPQDAKAILRCRRRVFDLAHQGQLRVLTDQGHGRKGVEGVADAVDYMLRGEHVGKVVIEI